MTDAAPTLEQRLRRLYPLLGELPAPMLGEVLATQSQVQGVPAGQLLFEEGAPCRGFPMPLSGEVRVARGTPGGRAIELYRVGPGELCAVSSVLEQRRWHPWFADASRDEFLARLRSRPPDSSPIVPARTAAGAHDLRRAH